MRIDVAEWRQVNHPLRNYAAICDDDNRIGLQRIELRVKYCVVLDPVWLRERNAEAVSQELHWRRNHVHAAPAWPVRLRDHQLHVKVRSELLKRGDSEFGCAAEDQIHS